MIRTCIHRHWLPPGKLLDQEVKLLRNPPAPYKCRNHHHCHNLVVIIVVMVAVIIIVVSYFLSWLATTITINFSISASMMFFTPILFPCNMANIPPKCRWLQLCHSREPSPMAPPVLPGDDNLDIKYDPQVAPSQNIVEEVIRKMQVNV